jgi:uncharacterized protein
MNSKIYFGRVQHRRFSPKQHQFSYGLFMLYLDLDELPNLFQQFWLWSKEKPNVASFFNRDYLCDSNGDIRGGVEEQVKKHTGVSPQGPIRMLTHLRYAGHSFNPVTFYYCFDTADKKVEFIVAQINNTPWDERFCYVLDNRESSGDSIESQFTKAFHVSPFLPMDMHYRWRFSSPRQKLSVLMQNFDGQDKVFDATLVLKAKSINSTNLARALLQFPLITWQVTSGIYWQALRLWLKGIPFFSNPHAKAAAVKSANIEQ